MILRKEVIMRKIIKEAMIYELYMYWDINIIHNQSKRGVNNSLKVPNLKINKFNWFILKENDWFFLKYKLL